MSNKDKMIITLATSKDLMECVGIGSVTLLIHPVKYKYKYDARYISSQNLVSGWK